MSELCPLRFVSVAGTVNNFIAQVIVSQTYLNESEDPIDCTFLVPFGSYDQLGVVCDWLVERDTTESLANVVGLKEGNAMFRAGTGSLFDRINNKSTIREPTFVCSVGNLLPGEDVTVRFSFLAPLESTPDGVFRFTLPLNFGSSSQPVEVEIGLTVTSEVSDIRFVESPSHAVVLQENGRRRKRVTMKDRRMQESGDFVLRIGAGSLEKPVAFVEKSALGDLTALVSFRPSLVVQPPAGEAAVVVALIDGGALFSNDLRKQCAEFLSWFVPGLTRSQLSLMFVGADTIVRLSSVGEVAAAMKFTTPTFKETTQEALQRVYERFASSSSVSIVLIGDGDGFTDMSQMLAKVRGYVHKFRVFVFGVGSYIRASLDALAKAGQGRSEFAHGLEVAGSVAQKAQCLARSIEQALLAVVVDWGNFNTLLHPTALWDHAGVFDGDLVHIMASLHSSQDKQQPSSAIINVKLSVSAPNLSAVPTPISIVVDPRKYVKQDNITLLATRCVLYDQASGGETDVSDVTENSIAMGLAVPGLTTFAAFLEDPSKGSYLGMLTIYPGKAARSVPNSRPYPLRPTPAIAAAPIASGSPSVTVPAKQRSASILDIARAKPRPAGSAAASLPTPVLAPTAGPARVSPRGDGFSDSEDSPPMARGKSMDSSPGGKKTYDMNALLRFRQASLDNQASASMSIGADLASMSTSPKTKKKGRRGERGAGGGGGGGGGRVGSYSPSKSPAPIARVVTPSPAPVAALVVGENAWRPKKLASDDTLQKDLGKMRGILNKVTVEKMDYFIEQLLEVKISTKAHLRGLIELIFERVLSAQSMTPMYAELCHKISTKCPVFQDAEEGELSFRRLLLNRCQREFEDKNKAIAAAGDLTVGDLIEAEFKMKRRILGNIRFVGELFRLGMLGHTIVVSCIVSLLPLDRLPDVEDLEVMVNLLMTTGVMLEKCNEKTNSFVKECFAKIQKLANNQHLEARIRFKLHDLIDLRANGWKAIDTSLVRRRPSAAAARKDVKEVVTVGAKRAVSRVPQKSQPSSPKTGPAPSAVATSSHSPALSPPSSPATIPPSKSRQSWGSKGEESLTSPTQTSRRRHNQAADTQALEKSARELLDEYFSSYDADEACACISELDSPGWLHRMVVISVMIACNSGSVPDRKLVVKLLCVMRKENLVDNQQLMRGFQDLLEDLPSLLTDTPVAAAVLGYCLGALMSEGVLTTDDLAAVDFAQYDKEAIVSTLGFMYDHLVDSGKEKLLWTISLDSIEPDAEKRKRALKKTVHAIKL